MVEFEKVMLVSFHDFFLLRFFFSATIRAHLRNFRSHFVRSCVSEPLWSLSANPLYIPKTQCYCLCQSPTLRETL
jgi:hypothetical protein